MNSLPKVTGQFLRFLIIGTFAFLVDYVTYLGLTKGLQVHYLWAGFISFTVSLMFNYALSMRFVFKPKTSLNGVQRVLIFTILSLLGLGLSLILLYGFVDGWGWPDHWAKLIVTGIVMIFNFVSRKRFIEQPELTAL